MILLKGPSINDVSFEGEGIFRRFSGLKLGPPMEVGGSKITKNEATLFMNDL